nr:zinc finger, CCHC-type [Tanacetum cinerariifolium]
MASMNTRLNIKKIDGNIVQNHGGSKQVGFKQLGPGVETGVHEVHDENVFGLRWNCRELKGIVKLRFFRDRSRKILRVSQSRFYNGKLVQTLLEGHSILLLEGCLSGDCDVEKN